MKKRQKTKLWLSQHRKDPYVKQAQKDGYRSRACYKLIDILAKHPVCRKASRICELGSAPGGWTQVLREQQPSAEIVAVDLLPMAEVPGVLFRQGDCRDPDVRSWLVEHGPYDFICSDMSPNKMGVADVDQARAVDLWEMCLDLCEEVCAPSGHLLLKIFHSKGFDTFVKEARQRFEKVYLIKPDASRSRSRELYLLGKGFTLSKETRRESLTTK